MIKKNTNSKTAIKTWNWAAVKQQQYKTQACKTIPAAKQLKIPEQEKEKESFSFSSRGGPKAQKSMC